MPNFPTILVMMATYNELENLPELVGEIRRVVPEADILVVDDNSPDGTGRWCDEQAALDGHLRCLHRGGKQGLGTATIAGMRYAIDHAYTYLINLDADFSHHPRYMPALLAGMDPAGGPSADVMIASRYITGGGVSGWPWRRRAMSKAVNAYSRLFLGLSVRDCSGAFRCYRTSMLAKVNFDRVLSRGYSFQEEILWHLKRLGARFGETPITFVDRVKGQSKINLREATQTARVILALAYKNFRKR